MHTIELRDKNDEIIHSARVRTETDDPPLVVRWDERIFVYYVTTDSHPSIDTSVVNVYHEVPPFDLTSD